VQIGDTVLVAGGPLAGRVGRLAGVSGQRVLVEMRLWAQQIEVEMDPDWVDVVARRKSPARVDESVWERLGSDQA